MIQSLCPTADGRWWVLSQHYTQPFTVAVVSNSASLFDEKHGEEIDSHDCVIRMNRAAQLYEDHQGHESSHGARTDVWCMWRYREYENARVHEPYVKCQMGFWLDPSVKHPIHNIVTRWFLPRIHPHTPSTGLMTLAWLSAMPCARVTAYGFDWKKTPTFTDVERKSEQRSLHNFDKEKELCMKYFQEEKGFEFR